MPLEVDELRVAVNESVGMRAVRSIERDLPLLQNRVRTTVVDMMANPG